MEPDGSSTETDGRTLPVTVLDHKRLNEWLLIQKKEQEVAKKTAKSLQEISKEIQDPELQKDRIQNLQKTLADASGKLSSMQLVVKRMQLGGELLKYLYPHSTEDGSGDQAISDNNRIRVITSLVEKQSALVTEILDKQKSLEEKKLELQKIRKDNMSISIRNRELLHEIKERKESPVLKDLEKNPEIQSAKQSFSKILDKVTVQRHLFQGLILGSGINWAKDKELCDLMIELGESPKFD